MKKQVGFVVAIALLSYAGVSYASHLPFGRQVASQTAVENAAINSASVHAADNSQQPAASGTDAGSAAVPPAKSDTSNLDLNREVKLDVSAQSQEPELFNGCEVTSLSMLLSAAGHPVDKLQLAEDIAKDSTPEVRDEEGNTLSWGDPNVGFVGDVTGENRGYGVYHGPVYSLLNKYIGNQAKDLTGKPFEDVEAAIAAGHPVVVWTTVEFKPSTAWVTWKGPNGSVRATLDEHAVLLVGFNEKQLFVNDPLDGTAAKAVDKDSFVAAWKDLGNQAVTFSSN